MNTKEFESMKDANNALPDLGSNEVVCVMGILYRVHETILGRCLRRIRDTEFCQDVKTSPDGRNWNGGTKNGHGMKTSGI